MLCYYLLKIKFERGVYVLKVYVLEISPDSVQFHINSSKYGENI